jgi:hypothetical protein
MEPVTDVYVNTSTRTIATSTSLIQVLTLLHMAHHGISTGQRIRYSNGGGTTMAWS